METYFELLRRDAYYHGFCDTSTWPPSVTEFAQSLQNELRIPSWLKSGSVPYTDERVASLLNRLRASDDVSNVHLWDNADKFVDRETEERLHVVFNTALVDCARIQAVVETENLTDTPYPKESFLVILVRNAILDSHAQLSALEDIPVVLPRHYSGETIPILKYMKKSIYVPLVISVCQEMPIEENIPHLVHPSREDEDSSVESELFKYSPPTMSEFLDNCERTMTLEEVVEEPEDDIIPPSFEAHFLACTAPPAICHLPVLCMADEEQLPVLMSSLLYQRRVWHINEPLIGLEFSKYDSVIKLFVGWLEDDLPSDRVLPRVHLGEIRTPMKLDLSSPSGALVISYFLCGLESCVASVRGTARHSVGTVIGETRSISSLSWRIDTDIRTEDPASILKNDSTRDVVTRWVKSQKHSVCESTMSSQKQADKSSLSNSATSKPPPQSTSTRPSHSTPSSSILSEQKLQIPQLREPPEELSSVPTFCSRLSCSEFAATGEKNDQRVFRWMFDRRVIPQSIPSDLEFREEYSAMTRFIWPETWHARENLPPVDAALEPCVQELLEGVSTLKTRPNAVDCIPVAEFPVDLRVLVQSFSAIFQASRRSREKKTLGENMYEISWRHDHDRLLFDFFIRLIQQRKGQIIETLPRVYSIGDLEDPLARPTLEATLRFPKSDYLQKGIGEESLRSMRMLIRREAEDLDDWVRKRGGSRKVVLEEVGSASRALSHWLAWTMETDAETETQTISKLGQLPSTGRCDALGRLLVDVPSASPEAPSRFPLVVRAATNISQERTEDEVSKSRSKAQANTRGQIGRLARVSANSLIVPDYSGVEALDTRYTMLSSSIPSSMPSPNAQKTASVEPIDSLTHNVQRFQIGRGVIRLELPILAVEYKKASGGVMKGTNQLRMYLTSSVKFLQAVGIKNFTVYGVQTDGPIVVLPAAVLRDDDFVHLFERLVEKLDISTPLGAWHYATILCRLAQNHAQVLEHKFEEIRENVNSILEGGSQSEGWTLDHQMARLIAENRAKSKSPPKGPKKLRSKAD